MLDEKDRRAWFDIVRRLNAETAGHFLAIRFDFVRRIVRARCFPYVMAVAVPMLLPALSFVRIYPVTSAVIGLVVVAVCVEDRLRARRRRRRELAGHRGGTATPPR